eukprot:Blabericola_migrator_1__6184@NODE_311_length_10068_cov_114_952505_g254_i0_p1_GENE_NODE_311_length_10068_cov_114_952505_g254_i0NODE_311_length_10068_cov_114_952505_g254_i0_p1_ORF_typecomplete_len1131_score253_54Ufd2P_core/PF10408_9/1_9e102Ubox/PF04564_15/8_5e21MH1/PF03165_16/0_46_NODE_311_length_10068_cov_114_952505_g254_i028506242
MSRRSSFQSCTDGTASSMNGPASTGAEEMVDVEADIALNSHLQQHALLEYVLCLCWKAGNTNSSKQLKQRFESNQFSQYLNIIRPDKSSVCVNPSHSVSPLYHKGMRAINLDQYVQWSGSESGAMSDGDRELLHSGVVEDLLMECLREELHDTRSEEALNWLATIHQRASLSYLDDKMPASGILKMMRKGESESPKAVTVATLTEALETIASLAVNYAALLLTHPSIFGGDSERLEPARLYSFLRCFATRNYSKPFLMAVVEAMSGDVGDPETAREIMQSVWATIHRQLSGRRFVNCDTGTTTVISILLQNKMFAEALVRSDIFLPVSAQENGWDLMMESFFGRLFRPVPMDYLRTGDEKADFVSAVDKYFPHVSARGAGFVQALSSVQVIRSSHINILKGLVEIVKSILRHGGVCKEKALGWFAAMLEANVACGSLGFRHNQPLFSEMGQLEALMYKVQKVSSPPFAMNVAWILLMLCDPIQLARINDLDPLYPSWCKKNSTRGMLGQSINKESTLVGDSDIAEKGEALVEKMTESNFGFTCQIFWLTLKAVGVLLIPSFNYFELKHQRVAKSIRGGDEKPGLMGEILTWIAVIEHESFINSVSHFSELACSVLLRAAFAFDQEGKTQTIINPNVPQPLQALNVNLDLVPLAPTPPPQFALLPYAYFSDVFSLISKMFTISSSSFKPDSAEHFMASTNLELLAASVLFILRDPGNYIRNVSLKLEAAAYVLLSISLMKSMPHRFANTQCVRTAMAPSLITAFIEAQKASYYQRIDLRLLLTREFERFLPQAPFQKQIATLAKTHQEEFERFIHYFASNTSWVLEEALQSLAEVKKREKKEGAEAVDVDAAIRSRHPRHSGREAEGSDAERAEAERLAQEMEGTRTVSDMPFEELAQHCKSLMEAGGLSLKVLKLLVEGSTDFIRHSEVLLTQMVLYLNNCLNSLVGPRCLELKVTNFEAYNFKPRELLATLAFIYVKLAKDSNTGMADEVVSTIAAEDRFFKMELFVKACGILQREGIVSRDLLEDFRSLSKALTEKSAESKLFDDLLADDVPAEFMDPLMAEIMKDPVLLPSSGVIVERRVIERHLISDEFDPFNRAPLKKSELVPQPELKERIQEFIRTRQEQRSKE